MPRNDEEVIAGHACKTCFAKRGEPCIYLAPAALDEIAHTPRGQALWKARGYGKPTKIPHLTRRQAYWRAMATKRRADELNALREAPGPPWLAALRQFDADEVDQMRDWLRANWRLFCLRRLP